MSYLQKASEIYLILREKGVILFLLQMEELSLRDTK